MTSPTWDLGPKLQAAREALRLSKREAAKKAGVSEQLWRRLETGYYTVQGRRIPLQGEDGQNKGVKRETLIDVARAVGLDVNEALADVGFIEDEPVPQELPTEGDDPLVALKSYVDMYERVNGPAAADEIVYRLWRLRNAKPNDGTDQASG